MTEQLRAIEQPTANATSTSAVAPELGIWRWSPEEETWDLALRALLQPLLATKSHQSPRGELNLLSLLKDVDQQRLITALDQATTSGIPFHLAVGLRSHAHPIRICLRGGVLPGDPNSVVASCQLVQLRNTDHAPTRSGSGRFACHPNEQFCKLVENSAEVVQMLDQSGTVRYTSPSVQRVLGYQPSELEGENALDFSHPDERNDNIELLKSLLERPGNTVRQEMRLRAKNKAFRWVEVVATNHLANPTIRAIVANYRDVTERWHQEQKIRNSERQLRETIDSCFGFIGLLDLNGQVIEINRSSLEAGGLQRGDVVGQKLWDLYFFSHCDSLQRRLREVFQRVVQGETERFETAARVANDGQCIVDLQFRPMQDEEGMTTGVVGFAVDITERKDVERSLRMSENRLRDYFQNDVVPTYIWQWDPQAEDFRFVDYNAAAERFTKGRAKENAGTTLRKMPCDYPEIWSDLEKAFLERKPQRREVTCRDEDAGTIRHLDVTYSYIPPDTVMVHTDDITARRKAEEQMRELRQQLTHAARVATMGETAAGIAHELNQPLAAIGLYADGCRSLLEHGRSPSEVVGEKLAEISRLAATCGEIIRRLRRFASRRTQSHSTVDIREVIRTVMKFVEPEIRISETPLAVSLPEQSLWVKGDAVELQQLLLNLLRNAMESNGSDAQTPRIELRARETDDRAVEISVSDWGSGISEKALEQLFDPFFTTKANGMGMGLKISQTIVRAHGGTIDCHSESGKGTTFIVRFPNSDRGEDE